MLTTANAALEAVTEASNDTEGAEDSSPAPASEPAPGSAAAAAPIAAPAASTAEVTPAPEDSPEQQAVSAAVKVPTLVILAVLTVTHDVLLQHADFHVQTRLVLCCMQHCMFARNSQQAAHSDAALHMQACLQQRFITALLMLSAALLCTMKMSQPMPMHMEESTYYPLHICPTCNCWLWHAGREPFMWLMCLYSIL